jgi:hypothetical protein
MTAAGAPKSTESAAAAEVDAAPSAVDLDSRIASALSEPLPSSEVAALIAQAKQAATEAQARAAAAKRKALNPRLPTAEVARARREMEDGAFISERMKVAIDELDVRHKELAADEDNARRIARYEEVVAERDAAAAELCEIYPPFAERFRDVMTRIGRIDNEVAVVNRNLPRGKMPLAAVEPVARGVAIGTGSTPIAQLATSVVLPAWSTPHYAWPKSWRMGAA